MIDVVREAAGSSLSQRSLPLLLLLLKRQKLFVGLEELLLRLQEFVLENGEFLPAASRGVDEARFNAGSLFQVLRADD